MRQTTILLKHADLGYGNLEHLRRKKEPPGAGQNHCKPRGDNLENEEGLSAFR